MTLVGGSGRGVSPSPSSPLQHPILASGQLLSLVKFKYWGCFPLKQISHCQLDEWSQIKKNKKSQAKQLWSKSNRLWSRTRKPQMQDGQRGKLAQTSFVKKKLKHMFFK
jgi:hypothetical protein